jgi:hypothetical protein
LVVAIVAIALGWMIDHQRMRNDVERLEEIREAQADKIESDAASIKELQDAADRRAVK